MVIPGTPESIVLWCVQLNGRQINNNRPDILLSWIIIVIDVADACQPNAYYFNPNSLLNGAAWRSTSVITTFYDVS